MKVFKITSKSQMEHLTSLFRLAILFYLLGKGFMYFTNSDDWTLPLFVLGAWYLIMNCIPQLILHFRYYHLNKDDELIFNPEKLELTMTEKELKSTFLLDDIKLVKQYKSHPFAEKRILVRTFDCYNYSILYLNDGRRFVITSLMIAELNLPLEETKIELKKSLLAYPRVGHIWEMSRK